MMDKVMMRKKAMDSMMKETPSIMVSVKKKSDPMMEESEDEGMLSMMVTPEEKAMIEKMRGEQPDKEESEEMDEY